MRNRIIPVLLLKGAGVVKTVCFKDAQYIGDPLNAVSIFNDKMIDELIVLDIDATHNRTGPRMDLIRDLAAECFMPLGYGGGVRTIDQASCIFKSGIEKIIFNTAFFELPSVVHQTAQRFGSQSVVVSIDVKREPNEEYQVYVRGGSVATGLDPIAYARRAEEAGAGELIIQSIDRDGTYLGYDLKLLRAVSDAVNVPVVALGGASCVDDLVAAVRQGGVAAAAAGSIFVYFGRLRAVLINTPSEAARVEAFSRDGTPNHTAFGG